jgi:Domain of unknown function (DUF4129)
MALAAVGVAVFALLLITAVGSQSLPGTTRSLSLSWTVDVIEILQVGAGLLIVGAILWSVIAGRRQREEDRPLRQAPQRKRPAWAVLLVLFALALLIWILPRQERDSPEEVAPDFTITEVDFPPVESIGSAWPLLVLAAGTVVAAFAVSRLGRPEDDEATSVDAGALLADTLDSALDDLSWSDDPRSVIIKAYHDIERTLSNHDLGRRPSEAPREYLERVLGGTDLEPAAVTTLTELFEQARYSDHQMSSGDRRNAIDAMESVRDGLTVTR